jgi:acetylornithine/succinyldiaminopimelate/putrescine aminotransferase
MDPSVTDFIAREARFGARNYEPIGVVLSRGEGVFVWDTQGQRYLDCLSAYSAVNQGHCHPVARFCHMAPVTLNKPTVTHGLAPAGATFVESWKSSLHLNLHNPTGA